MTVVACCRAKSFFGILSFLTGFLLGFKLPYFGWLIARWGRGGGVPLEMVGEGLPCSLLLVVK